MNATYTNSFFNPERKDVPKELTTEAKPVAYKGHLIYERIKGTCWDIVFDGVCIGMNAGLNGAKRRIDEMTTQNNQGKQLTFL
jgi:hypothetical protein